MGAASKGRFFQGMWLLWHWAQQEEELGRPFAYHLKIQGLVLLAKGGAQCGHNTPALLSYLHTPLF